MRFQYPAPIGSGAPHRTDLEVYFFEINQMNLPPYRLRAPLLQDGTDLPSR